MNNHIIERNIRTAEFLGMFLTQFNKSVNRLFTELKTSVKCKLDYADETSDTYYINKDFFINKIKPIITLKTL